MVRCFAALVLCCCVCDHATPLHAAAFQLQSNDVAAFIGGSDVAAMAQNGHLETALAVRFPGARFRNFGWEGDTVFAQPRDVGFPRTTEQVKRAGATVVFLQFGRGETLDEREPGSFAKAFEKLALEYARVTPRIVLVTPAPFERAQPPLPDLSARNELLARHAEVTRALAARHEWPVVDVFSQLTRERNQGMTIDGWQLTALGHVRFAEAFFQAAGIGQLGARDQDVAADGTFLGNKDFETVRQRVIAKNHLWLHYWRPHNWAFLGGDRTTQPSSRDHTDPKVRWMPVEMEKYVPLIREKENEIGRAVQKMREQ
jgi:hypothetical protein